MSGGGWGGVEIYCGWMEIGIGGHFLWVGGAILYVSGSVWTFFMGGGGGVNFVIHRNI